MNTPSLNADHKVVVIHRLGAVVVALVIATFGVLGFVGGLGFFDTEGTPVAGLSSNGLLSTISVVTALVLIASAARGGRLSSTVMIVVGTLFLVSAFANLAVMNSEFNLLAFRLPNVFFSIGAGLVLLILGSYGRVSAKLPDDNPYRTRTDDEPAPDPTTSLPSRPRTTSEMRADREMAEASRAAVSRTETPEQRRRLAAIDQHRTHEDRRAEWIASAEQPHDRGSAMA